MTDKDLNLQSFVQPMDTSGSQGSQEPLPVYDNPETGIELRDEHSWSFDTTLAQVLDIGLTMIMNHEYTPNPDGIEKARDTFRRYARKDEEGNFEDWRAFQEMNGPLYGDLMDALAWLRENFTGLWT